ncbi:folate family ECF transporter S component [Erysipelothrix sp. HDW6C]|uniref:folate family ECF transporter S component n=1 Tax=Erysipelothrix sp. HDW6C TaxID=2714930 RepID=UPI00140C5ED9|nr:folate family ECF transporter S component [Erysipelothrix sp. HDW6C]QIK69721.1 folate family ECF transporter S component [Erysipelothrix sp. HDW6C]
MKTKKLVLMALFIVIEIVFTRFVSINTPITRVGFSFVPMAIAGYMMGVFNAGIIALIADLIGATLWPSGPYFIGFSISAFLTGAAYGILKGKEDIWKWMIVVALFNTFIVNIGLNTWWLQIMYGKTWDILLPPRIGKALFILPIKVLINGKVLTVLKNHKSLQNEINSL